MPIIILGGSDRRPADLPEGASAGTSLSGFKGADVRIHGEPLVRHVERRIRASEAFGPIYLAGPARVYRSICPEVELVDTNADFGTNIERAMGVVEARHPDQPVAFITCDILPTATTLSAMAQDYLRAAPCDLWFAVVRVPDDFAGLGASAWKPRYRLVPTSGEAAAETLGGHLVFVQPGSLRLGFLTRLFRHAYATRNRGLAYRRTVVVRKMISSLIAEDLRRLVRLRRPDVTWTTLRFGVWGASKLGQGTMTLAQLERVLANMLIDRDLVREKGVRVRVPMVDHLSLALDIDTEEEAHARGAS